MSRSKNKNKQEEEHSDRGARLRFREIEFEPAMQCMSWCVASIPLLIWIARLTSVLRGQVHWCTDAEKNA